MARGNGAFGSAASLLISAMFLSLLALSGCSAEPTAGPASATKTGDLQLSYTLPEAGETPIPYRVYLPSNWTAARKWPLVVVLHGYSGNANSPFEDAQGLLQKLAEQHGFVILSPNGYNGMGDYGANLPLPSALPSRAVSSGMTPQKESALAEADVDAVLDRASKDYNVDPRRIYLMGNSMGMTGVLHFASTEPTRWCAISASDGPPWSNYPMERLKPISGVLLVHGALDNIADPADTRALADKAKALGIDARMQLMPNGTHGNAWIQYLPETFDFFAEHRCGA